MDSDLVRNWRTANLAAEVTRLDCDRRLSFDPNLSWHHLPCLSGWMVVAARSRCAGATSGSGSPPLGRKPRTRKDSLAADRATTDGDRPRAAHRRSNCDRVSQTV